jgi:hypothetical protein
MLIAETVFIVGVVCGGSMRKAETGNFEFSSVVPAILACAANPPNCVGFGDSVKDAIAKDFYTIPSVKNVFIEEENGEAVVRISVPHDVPRDIRYEIYDKQSAIVEAFPEMLFDFSLVPVGADGNRG